jgi:hypothetical protein
MVADPGCVIIAGGVTTVTVAKAEFTLPAILDILIQKLVVSVKAGELKVGELTPTGVVVLPTGP